MTRGCRTLTGILALAAWVTLACHSSAYAQDTPQSPGEPAGATAQAGPAPRPTFEVYGFAMLDIGHDFRQIDPDWFDTMRVARLPSYAHEFGRDHRTFASVRQSRFGLRSSTPTALGDLRATLEFELFGIGVDAGQTAIRLREAYGELRALGAGQTWSPFVDPEVLPNSLDYWGPTGMASFQNVQVRWMPVRAESHRVTLAIERPGASGDQGVYANRVELRGIKARFPAPDLSGAYKYSARWGHIQTGGLLRILRWDDVNDDQFDLSGGATGWGLSLSSVLDRGSRDTLRLQLVFGEGIQNYMNDAPVDVGIADDASDLTRLSGVPLPIVGVVGFLEHQWSAAFSSTIGYSRTDITNSPRQDPSAYRTGHYAVGNLLYYPVPQVQIGGELQWGRRQNFSDGFSSDGLKVQVSFKYDFACDLTR